MNRFYTYFLLSSLLIVVLPYWAKAQGVCDQLPAGAVKGAFEIVGDITAGCSPIKVEVNDLSGGGNIQYDFNYNGKVINAKNSTSEALFATDRPVTYTILQVGEKGGSKTYACKDITVYPAIQFGYNICNVSNVNTAEVRFTFPKQEILSGNTLHYQIGNGNEQTITELPFQDPASGVKTINLPENIKVYYKDQSGKEFCSRTLPLTGGSDNPFKPQIDRLEMLTDNQAKLTINGNFIPPYDLFMYESTKQPDPNKAKQKVSQSENTIIIPDSKKSYCFFVKRETVCGGWEESPDICTIPLSEVENTIQANDVHWVSHNKKTLNTDFSSHLNISRDVKTHINYEIDDQPQLPIQESRFKSEGHYKDEPINCKKTYCYQIEAVVSDFYYNVDYKGISLSQKKCYDPAEVERSPLKDFYTSVENNGSVVQIDYQKADNLIIAGADRYLLYLQEGTDFLQVAETVTKQPFTFTDKNPDEASLCFKVGYQDKCGSYAQLSDEVCTIHLSADDFDQLHWTPESPFSPYQLSSYELEELNPDVTVMSFGSSSFYEYSPDLTNRDEKIRYRITAFDENGARSRSNVIEITPEFKLILPNAFSPNGDHLNDIFKLEGKTRMISDYSLEITNRWGIQVIRFDDNDFLTNGWDGKINNNPIMTGTYAYQLRITLISGEQINEKGYLNILR